MKAKPGISVVIPLHNKAPHIVRCLESVRGQTYGGFEALVIDDASTDGSAHEMGRVVDPRIRVLTRASPGPGGYAARNLGISEASSDWVAFLDADDAWEPEHLERTRDLIARFPDADLFSCGWITHRSDSERHTDGYYNENVWRGDHRFDVRTFMGGDRPTWTSVVTVRRRRLLDAGGFDEAWRHGGDTALWLKLLLTGSSGAWYAGLGATYYKDSVNMVTNNPTQTVSPSARVIQQYLVDNPSTPLARELRRYADRVMTKPTLRLMATQGISRADLHGRFYFERHRSRVMILLSLLPRFLQRVIAARLLNRYQPSA
jgi:glycosyltransferase involved in cell wall biosynthesis